jgi:hypothetical protein
MVAMWNEFWCRWAGRSIHHLVRLSGARILGFLVSMCIGTVIRVWPTNMKEIFNLRYELPRWWTNRSILLLMHLQHYIGAIIFIIIFIIVFVIVVFVIVLIIVFVIVFVIVLIIVFVIVFVVIFVVVFVTVFVTIFVVVCIIVFTIVSTIAIIFCGKYDKFVICDQWYL